MTTETSKVHAFLNALVDGLNARPALIEKTVQVASAWLGGDTDRNESIQFSDAEMSQEWGLLGNKRREETFTVAGSIGVHRAGKNEPVIREVRERVLVLLGEVEDFLRVDPSVGNVVKVCQLKDGRMDQGATDEGRWCQFD